MNMKLHKNNTSGVTGVHWYKAYSMWRAEIKACNKKIYLGCFYNFEDAVAARHEAEDEYFGEFAARHSKSEITYTGPDLFA
jgi:hypothetical protein